MFQDGGCTRVYQGARARTPVSADLRRLPSAVTVTSLPPPQGPLKSLRLRIWLLQSDGNGLRFLINRLKFRVGSLALEGCLPAPRGALCPPPPPPQPPALPCFGVVVGGLGGSRDAVVLENIPALAGWLGVGGSPVGPALEAVPLEQMAVKLWRRDKLGLTA